jgi:hypothetical protein
MNASEKLAELDIQRIDLRLEEVERKRSGLAQERREAVAALRWVQRKLLGYAAGTPPEAAPAGEGATRGDLAGKKIAEAAVILLAEAGQELSTIELIKRAHARGLVSHAQYPYGSWYRTLSKMAAKEGAAICACRRGLWRLR